MRTLMLRSRLESWEVSVNRATGRTRSTSRAEVMGRTRIPDVVLRSGGAQISGRALLTSFSLRRGSLHCAIVAGRTGSLYYSGARYRTVVALGTGELNRRGGIGARIADEARRTGLAGLHVLERVLTFKTEGD